MSSAKKDLKIGDGKARLDLVPLEALASTAEVFAHGAKKYEPWNWQLPRPPGAEQSTEEAYLGACLRHLAQHQAGYLVDPDSGLPHLAHAITSLLILTWHIENAPTP